MSKIILHPVTDDLISHWNGWVDSSENSTLYHYYEWLQAMAAHSVTQMIPLVIYRGNSVAGVFPVFLKKTTFLKFIFSPPPGCAVPYLGPIFLPQDLKPKDMESFRLDVMDAFEEFCRLQKADFIRITTTPGMQDARPFLWSGYSARPQYEYRLPIHAKDDDMLSSFQSETRTKIRRAIKYEDLKIQEATGKTYQEIFRLTSERYQEQGMNWLVSGSYVEQLMSSGIAGQFQTWAAMYKGKTVTGMLSFQYKGTFHEWIGGINPAERISGVNELLHWKIMKAAKAHNCRWYDLGGANTPHLSRPKSKYSPEPLLYFEFKKRNFKSRLFEPFMQMGWVKKFYKKFKSQKNSG